MSFTARFGLPLLNAGQAQKEMTHNEAITLVDALMQACVEAIDVDVPPESPQPGECWIVGAAPAGAWTRNAGQLAVWTGGGWRFVVPREGVTILVRDSGLTAIHRDGAWRIGTVAATEIVIGGDRILGARQPAISGPSGGSVVDDAARTAIAAILATLRTHGLIAAQ